MIQQLNDEKNSLQERLKIADDTLERQMKQIENLTLQLGEAERSLAEKQEDIETLDKTSKDEVLTCTCIIGKNVSLIVGCSKRFHFVSHSCFNRSTR